MRNTVSKEEVSTFKEVYCNENKVILEILKEFQEYLVEPILDVGAGNGDICFYTCPDKEVFMIDTNHYENELNSEKHKRSVIDFFAFVPEKQIKTVFISHTLQFIDDDVNKLNAKISQLNPENIILIINENDGFMGKILDWIAANNIKANPETTVPNFPENYILKDIGKFKAELVCDNFCTLAQQISYLMLFDFTEDIKNKLVNFLKNELGRIPAFPINQAIYIYSNKL